MEQPRADLHCAPKGREEKVSLANAQQRTPYIACKNMHIGSGAAIDEPSATCNILSFEYSDLVEHLLFDKSICDNGSCWAGTNDRHTRTLSNHGDELIKYYY